MAKRQFTEADRELVERRKLEKVRKKARFRFGKNFFIWFLGLLFGFILIFGGSYVGVGVIPLKTYFGEDGSKVSTDVSDKSALTVVLHYKDYSVGDFPIAINFITDALHSTGMDGIIKIDAQRFAEISFGGNIGEGLQNCVRVSKELFGDLGNVEIFDNVLITDDVTSIDTTSADFKAKIYYDVESGTIGTDAVWERAFDDDGNVQAGALDKDIYYIALTELPIGQLKNLIVDRLSVVRVRQIITALGGNIEMVDNVFGETTIAGLQTFDVGAVKLSAFLKPDVYTDLFTLLTDLTGKAAEEITVNDMATIDVNSIKLSAFLNPTTYANLYSILCDMTGKEAEEIVINDLASVDFANVKLSSVLDVTTYANLFDILCDMTGKTAEEITISDLASVDFANAKLSTFLDPTAYPDLYNILCDMTGKNADEITVNDLATADFESVKLSSFLAPIDYPELYAILTDVTGKAENELKLSDLSNIDFKNAKLSVFLAPADYPQLYAILCDMTGKTADVITVNDMASGNFENVRLASVLDTTTYADLYNIICDMTGKSANAITLSDLGSGNIQNLRLSVVLAPADHPDIYAIITDMTGKTAETVTIGDFGAGSIDNVKLVSILDPTQNEKLFDIMCDMTGKSANEITVADLTGATENLGNVRFCVFLDPATNQSIYGILKDMTGKDATEVTVSEVSGATFENVKLTTVLGTSSENALLNALLSDETVTLGNIGEKVNAMPINEVYNVECFTETVNGKAYKLNGDGSYELADEYYDGTKYYVNSGATVWFFVYYEQDTAFGIDADGYALKYNPKNVTFANLQSSLGAMSDTMVNVSIRQLILTGIMEGTSIPGAYTRSINDIINP